jgi:hypothetical protein
MPSNGVTSFAPTKCALQWLALVLSGALAVGCASKRATPAPAVEERAFGSADLATLRVNVAQKRVQVRHFVVADVDLVNTSRSDLWVNSRFLVNRPDAPGEVRDMWTLIEGPGTSPVGWTCMTNAHAPTAMDYRILKPGEKISTTILLTDCHDLDHPGEYRFAVFYQDGNSKPPPPPPGAVHLLQLLQSGTERFEVLP